MDYEEVITEDGWKNSTLVGCGDILILNDDDKEYKYKVISIKTVDTSVVFEVRKVGGAE